MSISNITEEEIGGFIFLMNNLGIYLPYIILTSFGTVVGVLGINYLSFILIEYVKNICLLFF